MTKSAPPRTRKPKTGTARDLAGRDGRHLPSERAYRATLAREAIKLGELAQGRGPDLLPRPGIEWTR